MSLLPAHARVAVDRGGPMELVSNHQAVDLPGPFSAAVMNSGHPEKVFTFPAGMNLSVEDRAEADRRYRIIEPLVAPYRFSDLWSQHGDRRGRLVEFIAQQHGVSRATIYKLLAAWDGGGLVGLVSKHRSDKGTPDKLNAAGLNFILASAHPRQGTYGSLSVREIYRAYCQERTWRAEHQTKPLNKDELRRYAQFLDENNRLSDSALLPSVCYDTVRTWFNRIPEVTRTLAREGLEAFSNTQEIISFRALAEIQPMDYVVLDHRMLDLFALVKGSAGWRLIRPWLTGGLDMRTRKWLAWAIVETPSSDSIASVLKRIFLTHGLPKNLYADNGKDYRSEWFEGKSRRVGEPYKIRDLGPMNGVFDTLGIRTVHAIVRRPRSKIIEPSFRAIAEFEKGLPWYCGNRPDARPEAFERLIERQQQWLKGEIPESPFRPIEHIAQIYDELLNSLNEREMKGEGMATIRPNGRGWLTPNECWFQLISGVEKRTVAPEVLSFCFRKQKELTVRHGEIATTFGGRQYHYRFLENPQALMFLNGRTVQVGVDPYDLGMVAVYHESRFLGLGHNVELRRQGEQDFVEDEKVRRRARREVRRAIEAIHGQVYVPGPEERLKRRLPVLPRRIEPQRAETPAAIPAPIMDAVRAAEAERAPVQPLNMIIEADRRSYRDDDPDDTQFHFFQREK